MPGFFLSFDISEEGGHKGNAVSGEGAHWLPCVSGVRLHFLAGNVHVLEMI